MTGTSKSSDTLSTVDSGNPRAAEEATLKEQILALRKENATLKAELIKTKICAPEMSEELKMLNRNNTAMESALLSAHRCSEEVWEKQLNASKHQILKNEDKLEAVSGILERLQAVLTEPQSRRTSNANGNE
ncbi:hypothetical protein SARC_09753 [Sphaeroforma arctica JP610]|uniref:Uncharacterized protein n=1 Tax=Sphaeroforma arctica JP610 TaxID=667725 RepID=A0A0L0FLZ3_9EUKA|nr:hypothetical protein SARC_09753 [Sphaeroforma arctica JP610]KNC77797.1 hypothetical protein SARC_09753 [Sphaeroforma arctica JP610]|eukprot:XP_014151699.1 hypothetical protein SARC_09753 [Sphaeroforma arctica JP610]